MKDQLKRIKGGGRPYHFLSSLGSKETAAFGLLE